MKVLHVISSMYRGGRERQLATIYKFSSNKDVVNQILIFNKKKDDYINEYGIKSDDVFYLTKKKFFSRLIEIKNIITKSEPDIIYTWGSFEFLFCFLLNPFIKQRVINGSI